MNVMESLMVQCAATVCPGGARVRFVHFWCPRFVTLANVEYLEVLLDLKIKFAGAIETKKYETNPMGSRSQKTEHNKKIKFF